LTRPLPVVGRTIPKGGKGGGRKKKRGEEFAGTYLYSHSFANSWQGGRKWRRVENFTNRSTTSASRCFLSRSRGEGEKRKNQKGEEERPAICRTDGFLIKFSSDRRSCCASTWKRGEERKKKKKKHQEKKGKGQAALRLRRRLYPRRLLILTRPPCRLDRTREKEKGKKIDSERKKKRRNSLHSAKTSPN